MILLAFDNQEISDWQNCAFYHFLRHKLGWSPEEKHAALTFGTAWGLVQDAFWEAPGDPLPAMLAAAEEGFKPLRDKPLDLLKFRTFDTLQAMCRAYVDWAGPVREQYELLANERPFLLPLGPDPIDGEMLYHCGRADKELRRRSNGLISWRDHKTSSLYAAQSPHFQWSFIHQWWPNNQMLGYVWAGKQLHGEMFEDLIVEAALVYRKADGRKSKKNPEPEVRPVTSFDWIPMGYSDAQLEDWRQGRIQAISMRRHQTYAAKNTNHCINKYGTCEMRGLCSQAAFQIDQQNPPTEPPEGYIFEPWNTLARLGFEKEEV